MMKKLVFSFVLLFVGVIVSAQTDSTDTSKDFIVEEAGFPLNGYPAFYSWFNEQAKYPKLARKNNIEGRVIVKMVIDKEGNMTEIEIIKGIGGGCDEETLRVLSLPNAPKWMPAKQEGKPVKMGIQLPFVFKLQ